MPFQMVGAAAEYARRLFHGDFEETEVSTTAGTTQSELLKVDSERVFLMIVNLSQNACYLDFGNQVSSTRGIKLASNGGAFSLNAKDDLVLTTKPIHIIADAANSEIYYFTMRRFATVDPKDL